MTDSNEPQNEIYPIDFSVITPTWNRVEGGKLERCIRSVAAQTNNNYEHVIVDDASIDDTFDLVSDYPTGHIRYVKHNENKGRVAARNTGMMVAQGRFSLWLDSDDALDPLYLETLALAVKRHSNVHLWVGGAIVHGMEKDEDGNYLGVKHTTFRDAWVPPLNEDPTKPWVHAHFDSGKVGTGMFAYSRHAEAQAGLLPEWLDHCEVADGIDEYLGYETGYSCEFKWVGNPWGDDYAFFRKLTLTQRAVILGEGIGVKLYHQYVR